MYAPFPKHACGREWYPTLKYNEFHTLHTVLSVALPFPVWRACGKRSLRERQGNLSSHSKPAPVLRRPPGPLGRTNLSVLITVTDQNHGSQVIISGPRFLSPDCTSLISDNMLKVKHASLSSSFILKCMKFAVWLRTKVTQDFRKEIFLHMAVCRRQDQKGQKKY